MFNRAKPKRVPKPPTSNAVLQLNHYHNLKPTIWPSSKSFTRMDDSNTCPPSWSLAM